MGSTRIGSKSYASLVRYIGFSVEGSPVALDTGHRLGVTYRDMHLSQGPTADPARTLITGRIEEGPAGPILRQELDCRLVWNEINGRNFPRSELFLDSGLMLREQRS
jgi:hypothetical protein